MNKVKYLLTYRYSEIIHDLTVEIVEGVSAGVTSKSSEIKLLGVANASFEELLMDFEDYLRQNNLEIYPKTDPRVTVFRQKAYQLSNLSNLSPLGYLIEKPLLPENPQDCANFLLTLCHLVTFLLDKQIKASKEKFIQEGGLNEQLFNARKKQRGF